MALRPRHHRTAAYAAAAIAGGAVPVTVVNTGTFNPAGGLPAGVTLQAIDGGPTYYADNGFTNAASPDATMVAAGAKGWDDPAFFPIANDFSFYAGNSTSAFKALGLNTCLRATAGTGNDTDMSVLHAAGVWAILDGLNTNFGPETVGWHIEEPSAWTGTNSITDQASAFAGHLTGRFYQPSFTSFEIESPDNLGNTFTDCPCAGVNNMARLFTCTQGMPTSQHLNLASDDIFWFEGSSQSFTQNVCQNVYGLASPGTVNQTARGSNYGDMVDVMRSQWLIGTAQPAPAAPYIENEDALGGTGSRAILPQEFNWATWSTIVHGARMLLYFGTTSDLGVPVSQFGFSSTALAGAWGSRSMNAQCIATTTPVTDLARIINAPFALGYVTHNAGGYLFPTMHLVLDNGLDVCAKYYTGGSFTTSTGTFGNGLYILATVRGSSAQTNVSATFTIAGNYAGTVPVIRRLGAPNQAAGTVTVAGHQFTDTFSDAYSVHAYGPIPAVP